MKAISDLEMGIAIKLASNKYLDDLYDEFMSYNVSDVEVNPKINKRISRKISFSEWKDVRVAAAKVSKIAVMFACCIISAFFLAAMCITPVRAAFTEAILTWYNDYVTVSYNDNDASENIDFVIKRPEYVPQGFSAVSEDVSENSCTIEYKDIAGNTIIFRTKRGDRSSVSIDDNINTMQYINIDNNTEGIIYKNDKGSMVLMWKEDSFYYIVSPVELEYDIVEMAKSIK